MAACSVITPLYEADVSLRQRSYPRSRRLRTSPSGRIATVIEQSLAAAEQHERDSRLSSRFFVNLTKDRNELALISGLPNLARELGYGQAPTEKVLSDARILFARLRAETLRPNRIVPSADGGMSFGFRASESRRAYIEILNDGDIYAVTYRAGGDNVCTYTINSPHDEESVKAAIQSVRSYLEVGPLAPGTL